MGNEPSGTYTILRVLYYPQVPPTSELKPGQIRCGEHIDYGSITLLFQDPTGGLQVLNLVAVHCDCTCRQN